MLMIITGGAAAFGTLVVVGMKWRQSRLIYTFHDRN